MKKLFGIFVALLLVSGCASIKQRKYDNKMKLKCAAELAKEWSLVEKEVGTLIVLNFGLLPEFDNPRIELSKDYKVAMLYFDIFGKAPDATKYVFIGTFYMVFANADNGRWALIKVMLRPPQGNESTTKKFVEEEK